MSESSINNKLKVAILLYPGLCPLLMLNYWVKKKIPVSAVVISDFDVKHQGKVLNFFELVIGLTQECGWRYTLFMLCYAKFAVPITSIWNFFRRILWKEMKIKTFHQIAKEVGIPIYKAKDFNSPACHAFLENIGVNLIVSAYNNQILKKVTYALPRLGCVNIHPAMLPDFRGLDPVFQALMYGVRDFGVTIHRVDSKIDTGDIIQQDPIQIRDNDTLFSLNVRCWMLGARMLENVLEAIRKGAVVYKKQNDRKPQYPYESFPPKEQVDRFVRNGKHFFRWREVVKALNGDENVGF